MVQNEPQFTLFTQKFESSKEIYVLHRNNRPCICPDKNMECNSQCPFFMITSNDKSVKINLVCRTNQITIIIEDSQMKIEELEKLFKEHETNELQWTGKCHDCGKETDIQVDLNYETLEITIKGGAIYNDQNAFFLKCDSCFQKDPVLRHYQECEVYSRVVGYLRPVKQWNEGKQAEFKNRELFDIKGGDS